MIKFPPKVNVLFPLFTPVPPYVGDITPDIDCVPSKVFPYILLPVCNAEAVVALPVNAPINPVDVTEFNPVTLVYVPPNDIVVEPKLIILLANCALVIAALLDKLLVVKPVADIVPPDIEIPDPAVKAPCFELNIV